MGEKNEPAEENDSWTKKKRRRSIKIAWEMQLINWRIIVRYWPRPITPSFSLWLGSVCALPGCLTAAPSSESRRTVRLIESNHPRNDIGFSCAPSYVSRVLDRETIGIGRESAIMRFPWFEARRRVPIPGNWTTLRRKKLQGQCDSRESSNLLHFTDHRWSRSYHCMVDWFLREIPEVSDTRVSSM